MTSPNWPVASCRVLSAIGHYPSRASFGPRVRGDYEFIWMHAGLGKWTITPAHGGTQVHTLAPGELALGLPNDSEQFEWSSKFGVRHGYVHFDLVTALPPNTVRVRSLSRNPLLGALCDHLLALSHEPTRRAEHDALLGVLVGVFVADPPPSEPDLNPGLQVMLDHVTRQWQAQPTHRIATTELAEVAGISTGHVFRLFREAFDCSPQVALDLVRLSKAATALQRTNASLDQVATMTGYANAFHFSRRFRAAYGCPPGQFRATGGDPLAPLSRAGLRTLASRLLR